MGTIVTQVLAWLALLLCQIANPTLPTGLDRQAGTWTDPKDAVLVNWDPVRFEAMTGPNGELVLTTGASRGELTVVAADSALGCLQRQTGEIASSPGILFFDLSFAARPRSDPGATAGIYQYLGAGGTQIAYVECRALAGEGAGKMYLAVRIVSPAAAWVEALKEWGSVLTAVVASDTERNARAPMLGLEVTGGSP